MMNDARLMHIQCTVLQIRGYIRGKPLSVNHLLHIQGLGTYHMSKITKVRNEPCPLKANRTPAQSMDVGDDEEMLAEADPSKMEDLQMLADADELAGEQTWPTKDEEAAMMDAGWEDGDDHMVEAEGEGGSKVGCREQKGERGWDG